MIVNKYHLLFLNNKTKFMETDIINASQMSEAIDRCEAKHAYQITIIKCSDIQAIFNLRTPDTSLDGLIELWEEHKLQAVSVGNAIHRHVDMLIKHGYFKS
jgi:hypothetical protein